MLISENLFLYSIDEKSKKSELKNLPILLAGAILYDLELNGIITIQPAENIIVGPIVHLANPNKTGNAVLDVATNEILSRKRNFPVPYWLSKFRNKKIRKIIVENLILTKYIQQIGKKFEITKPVIRDEITNKIINVLLKDHEPDKEFRLFLMLSCLRSVNWKLLPREINYGDDIIKERLENLQEMMVKDTVGFYIAMQVPKTTYRVGGSYSYRF
jgi:hypothetical protein